MRMHFLIGILCLVTAGEALAYAIKPPALAIVASPDGSALLRVDPGTNTWVAGPWPPKIGEPAQPAQATVFLYDPYAKVYRVTATFALRNRIAPTTAAISNGAEFIVTCDDWDPQIGSTPNVVVVYRGSGEFVKAWSLEDIFTPAEIARFGPFPVNVPVRRWRGEKVSFINDSAGSAVSIPWSNDLPWQVSLRLDLRTLTFEKYPLRQSDQ